MISRTAKILSAAGIAATLVGTWAISRPLPPFADATGTRPAQENAKGAASGAMPRSPLHEQPIIACGMLSYSDCKTLEMALPM